MGPNIALANIRSGIANYDLNLVTDSFEALDGWLRRGGFLPDDWNRKDKNDD